MDDLVEKLSKSTSAHTKPIKAIIFRKRWETKSRAVLLACEDANEYVVKGRHAGRQIINDHIVGHLGQAMGAPVGTPTLIDVPIELQQAEPRMEDLEPGISHGSLWVSDCSERYNDVRCDEPLNHERFALLATLFGWCDGVDQQFIYSKQPPRLVYSVDHGHFFAGGPEWRIETLARANPPRPFPYILEYCPQSKHHLDRASEALKRIPDNVLVDAVSAPPDEWGLSMDERVTLLRYLMVRRDSFKAWSTSGV